MCSHFLFKLVEDHLSAVTASAKEYVPTVMDRGHGHAARKRPRAGKSRSQRKSLKQFSSDAAIGQKRDITREERTPHAHGQVPETKSLRGDNTPVLPASGSASFADYFRAGGTAEQFALDHTRTGKLFPGMSAPDITTAALANMILDRVKLLGKTLRITCAPDGGALIVFGRKESLQALREIGYASTENGIYHFMVMSSLDVHRHLEDILDPGVSLHLRR